MTHHYDGTMHTTPQLLSWDVGDVGCAVLDGCLGLDCSALPIWPAACAD